LLGRKGAIALMLSQTSQGLLSYQRTLKFPSLSPLPSIPFPLKSRAAGRSSSLPRGINFSVSAGCHLRFPLLNYSKPATTRALLFHRGVTILKSCRRQDAHEDPCSLHTALFLLRKYFYLICRSGFYGSTMLLTFQNLFNTLHTVETMLHDSCTLNRLAPQILPQAGSSSSEAVLKSCHKQDAPQTNWSSSDQNTLHFDRM